MKSSALAHPNIALIKYWGHALDQAPYLNIPSNDSVSMTKESISSSKSSFELITKTTIEFSEEYDEDIGYLKSDEILHPFDVKQMERITKVVNPLRELAGNSLSFKMISENSFPTSAGLASSASAFAALATATCKALNLDIDNIELSKYARLGSGSASRSLYGGFVHWHKGNSHETSFSEQICESNEFDMVAVIAVIDQGKKEITSDVGHNSAYSSAFNHIRVKESQKQVMEIIKAIKDDDFSTVGKISEQSCLYMHSVMMTSEPALFYWNPNTLKVIKEVLKTRNRYLEAQKMVEKGITYKKKEGIECYFTIDAGPNLHCFCRTEMLNAVHHLLQEIGIPDNNLIKVKPASYGTKLVDQHLF